MLIMGEVDGGNMVCEVAGGQAGSWVVKSNARWAAESYSWSSAFGQEPMDASSGSDGRVMGPSAFYAQPGIISIKSRTHISSDLVPRVRVRRVLGSNERN